jgi:hypothetical protein
MRILSKKDAQGDASDKVVNLLANEILSRQKLSSLMMRQFLIGVAYGLGATLGAAAVVGILAYIYKNFLVNLTKALF